MVDTKALAEATALIVREVLDARMAPFMERLAAIEAREPPAAVKGEPGEPGRDGNDGKDVDPLQLRAMVEEAIADAMPAAVDAAVAALPPAEKGEKGDPGQPGEPGPAGNPGADGKDGVGLADALIDRNGTLVLTTSDGRMKQLGRVVGADGKDGNAGTPGSDGRDGQDLTDIAVTQDGAVIELAFQVGEVRTAYEIELPAGPAGQDGRDAYPGEAKGLYDPEVEYRALDVVSFNGSEWRAKRDNPGEMPGDGWMLSACKGKRGERGDRGAPGRDGLSPVATYLRGVELVTTLSDGAELTADLSHLSGGAEE